MRERAEPVYQVQAMDWHDVEKYLYDEALDRGIRCRVLYTAPPATVVPKIDRKAICNKAHWLCARSPGATFYNAAEFALDEVMELLAPPAPVVADAATAIRACLEEFPESVHDIVEECASIAENACRAAMLQPVSQPYKLPLSVDVLAGALRNAPLAPSDNQGRQRAPVAAGWIACSERMPEKDGNYWAWWSESKRQGPAWFIKSELQAQFQSSEITHWMPLPEAPGKEG
nr:DUF551 domain-containing protein [Cronobacter malonaticus]